MRIGSVADAVELEVYVTQTGFGGLLGKLDRLGKFNAIGGGLYGVVANLTGVADGVEEVGRDGGFATGELDGHLATGLDLHRVVEHGRDVFPREFVDEADLIGVHEAGVAHHVAAVGQVDREDRTAAVDDRG